MTEAVAEVQVPHIDKGKREAVVPRAPNIPGKGDRGPRLHSGSLKPLSSVIPQKFTFVPVGTDLKTCLRPDFWAHEVEGLQQNMQVHVMPDDGAWYAILMVVYKSEAEAKMTVLLHKELAAEEAVESDEYSVEWKGPGVKFCVIHNPSKTMLKKGLYPKSEAYGWLRDHMKAMKT